MQVEENVAIATDGTRLWWRAAGRGAPAVILTDGIGCAGWIWRHLFPSLADHRRVVHWNLRGHGRSEVPRDGRRLTLLDCVDDLFTVLESAGETSAVLVGHSMGVQICLEAHRQHRERVEALALLCGVPGRVLDHFHGSRILSRVFPYLKDLVVLAPRTAGWCFHATLASELAVRFGLTFEVNRQLLLRDDLERYLADAAAVDVRSFARILASAARHDASDHLPEVGVPVLVVAGDKDMWTPFSLSIRMREAIPGSELLVLRSGTHAGPLEHAELVALRLEKFLRERVDAAPR